MNTPTSKELQVIKNLKQISREEFLLPGTSVCGGCGGLEALRLAAKVLGPKTVFVNAAGCFALLAVFPYTPLKGSWLYTSMASAAAGAQGVRDALDVLMQPMRRFDRYKPRWIATGSVFNGPRTRDIQCR